jgi:hypothetical protein
MVIAGLLRADVGKPLGHAIRCAAAIFALTTDSEDLNLSAVLAVDTASPNANLQGLAVAVLGDELATLLEDEKLIPDWVAPLFESVAALVATLTADKNGGGLTSDQAIDMLHKLVFRLDQMMTEQGLWDQLATSTGLPEMVRAIRAQTQVVLGLCDSLKSGTEIDKHTTREAISVAILMLIGQPLAQVISTVSERGLGQVPPALRALADAVDASDTPISINEGWDALGKQVLGTTVGFPVAQLLRHAAATAADWRQIRLPVELKMLKSFLAIDLANEFVTVGPAQAVSDFKKQILPILGQHVVDVVLTSNEFILRDSVNLFRDMATGTVTEICRSLEVSAIVAFKLVEEFVELAEQAVTNLQQQEFQLEHDAAQYSAQFLTALSNLTGHIRGLDGYVGGALTDDGCRAQRVAIAASLIHQAGAERSGLLDMEFAERFPAGRGFEAFDRPQSGVDGRILLAARGLQEKGIVTLHTLVFRAVLWHWFSSPFRVRITVGLGQLTWRGSPCGNEIRNLPAAASIRAIEVRRCMMPVQIGQRPRRLPSRGPSGQNSTSSKAGRRGSLQRRQKSRPGPHGCFRLVLRRFRKSIRSNPRMIVG